MPEETTTHVRRAAGAVLATMIAMALIAAGCGSNNEKSNGPTGSLKLNEKETQLEADGPVTRGGKLVVAVQAETNGWNPSVNQWADAGSTVGPSMIEPFVLIDASGQPEPFLATKWEHNADFTQWDITFRDGIKFHNGEDFNADAAKLSLENAYTGGLTKIALEPLYDHVETTGPLSIRVFLRVKWAQYPSSLNNQYGLAQEMLKREDKGVVNPIGTGPFKFVQWQQGDFLEVTAFDGYWRKDSKGEKLPYLQSIVFKPIVDDNSKRTALRASDIDMAFTTQASMATEMEGDYRVLRDYTSERTFIMLNTVEAEQNKGNPFTNIHARRALAYATDREAVAENLDERVQTTLQGYRPDSPWGVPNEEAGYYPYDLEKAKEEIELYKKDTGASQLSFTLTGLTSPEEANTMQVIQSQWKEAGIEAKINAVEQLAYISTIAIGYYQAGWFRWYGYANPDQNYYYNASEDSNPIGGISINFTHYTSPEMDKNLHIVRETEDFETRKAANNKVIKETNEQAINIWLFDTPYAIVANQKVHGLNNFITYPFGNFSPKPWWGEVWVA